MMRWRIAAALAAGLAMLCAEARALSDEAARAELDAALVFAGQQAYHEALARFTAVRESNPGAIEAIDGLKMAVVLGAIDEAERLREHSRWLAHRFRTPASATDAERSVKGYLIYPGASDRGLLAHGLDMTRRAISLAEAEGETELLPWFQVSLAVAKLRVQHYDAASQWLAKAIDADSLYIRGLALPFAAIAVLGAGDRDAAEALLERARETASALPEPGSAEYAKEWTDTIAARMALAEAEAAFAGKTDQNDAED